MPVTPFHCTRCNRDIYQVTWRDPDGLLCLSCASDVQDERKARGPSIPRPAHPSERAVVWENPRTSEVRYPGSNASPIPRRYREQGFVRKELPTLRDIHRFERDHKVLSEIAWFDRGSGRGHERDI